MNKYIAIFAADVKNTRRDPTLLLIFWVPVLILAVVRWGLPLLESYLPQVGNFYREILAVFVLLNAVFPGFILSFILLDEKDLQLLPVLHATPVSLTGFLMVRILFIVLFGFMGSLLLLFFNGFIVFSMYQALSLALLSALNAPVIILIIAAIAKNKVEGLTLLKVANIVLFIPLAVLFIDSPWENTLAVFPAFWVYKFIDAANYSQFIVAFGVLTLGLFNYLSFKFALNRLKQA